MNYNAYPVLKWNGGILEYLRLIWGSKLLTLFIWKSSYMLLMQIIFSILSGLILLYSADK